MRPSLLIPIFACLLLASLLACAQAEPCPLTRTWSACAADPLGSGETLPKCPDGTLTVETTPTGATDYMCDDHNPCTTELYDPGIPNPDGTVGACVCTAVSDGPRAGCAGMDTEHYTFTSPTNVSCTEMRCASGTCRTILVLGETPFCSAGKSNCKKKLCTDGTLADGITKVTQCTGPYGYTPCCGNGVVEANETAENCCSDAGCDEGKVCAQRINYCMTPMSAGNLENFDESMGGWMPAILIALIIGYFMAGLGFMLANFMRMPELEVWAKAEVREVSATAFIVANILVFVFLLNLLFSVMTLGKTDDLMAGGAEFIDQLSMDMLSLFGEVLKAQFVFGFMSYIGINIGGSVGIPLIVAYLFGVSGYPFMGAGIISTAVMTAANAASFAVFSVAGMKVFLEFVSRYMLTVFLPIGIVLRSFTLTRRMGGTLVAFALGLYVVYPLTLVMNGMIYNTVAEPDVPDTPDAWFIDVAGLALSPMLEAFAGPNFNKFCRHWYDWVWCWMAAILWWATSLVLALVMIAAMVGAMVVAMMMSGGPGGLASIGLEYYINLVPWMVRPMTAAFLLPLLDLVIVVTAIRTLSPALGGEERISGLMEFI